MKVVELYIPSAYELSPTHLSDWIIHGHKNLHIECIRCTAVFPLEGPCPVCEWLVYKSADCCNSGSHIQLRDALLHVVYSSGCTSVHIHSDYPSAHCKSKPASANCSLFMANIIPVEPRLTDNSECPDCISIDFNPTNSGHPTIPYNGHLFWSHSSLRNSE